MIKRLSIFLLLISIALTISCNNSKEPPYTKDAKPIADAEIAVMETDYGTIKLELYSNIAPKTVAQFKALANEGFYNGTSFHRVSPGLGIIQGGDPNSKDDDPTNDGIGDSTKPNVPHEFSDIPFDAGTLGAARKGVGGGLTEEKAWDTANCQFFIMTKKQPQFDKLYTVFGKVIEGLNNVVIIANAPREGEHPTEKVTIKSITFVKK